MYSTIMLCIPAMARYRYVQQFCCCRLPVSQHPKDTAKEAYRNATLEVTSLLQIVKMQADDSLSRQARADEMLQVRHLRMLRDRGNDSLRQRAQAVLTNTDVAQTEMTQLSVALHDFVSGISAEVGGFISFLSTSMLSGSRL